jgi:hypothetical protein
VATLVRDGLELNYEVRGGSGPGLLLPYVNFSWPEVLDLAPFTERFTVVIASPRGFAKRGRLGEDASYRANDLADDSEPWCYDSVRIENEACAGCGSRDPRLTAAGCGSGSGSGITTGMTAKSVRAMVGPPLRVVRSNPRNPDCWVLRNRLGVCFRHGRVDYYGLSA